MEGRSALQIDFAKKLAEWGHVGFAADLYGKDIGGANSDESERRMLAFMQNRPMLQDRLLHTIQVVRGLEEVDSSRTAAVGFCFGGLCALDVARTGIDLREVASFHGVLSPPGNAVGNKIKAR
jgi:dienelactone hydrolase